jgi:hypothetical protein
MKKSFDCVEMMHKGQERIRKETQGMTIEEQVAYWQRKADALRAQGIKVTSVKTNERLEDNSADA